MDKIISTINKKVKELLIKLKINKNIIEYIYLLTTKKFYKRKIEILKNIFLYFTNKRTFFEYDLTKKFLKNQQQF
jgi:hypothetical protein